MSDRRPHNLAARDEDEAPAPERQESRDPRPVPA